MSANLLTLRRTPEQIVAPSRQHGTETNLTEEALLKHYVQEGADILRGLDNLGNFLMGFGVLTLGYLLNSNLKPHFNNMFHTQEHLFWSGASVLAWAFSVVLLLGFMYLYVFQLLAGRTIAARNNDKNSIGQRIRIKNMSYEKFEKIAPTFDDFLVNNYLDGDRSSSQQTWYATFRYTRYMAFKKLMVMNQMRTLLAWALISGVLFKLVEIVMQAL